jgi:hypothetical protein
VSTLKQVRNEIGRALAVLSMLFLCLAAAPPDVPSASVVQQAGSIGSLYSSLCGSDHDQPQLACHAPNACCRPDQALAPPRIVSPEPAYRRVAIVDYAAFRPLTAIVAAAVAFRSRAPPV